MFGCAVSIARELEFHCFPMLRLPHHEKMRFKLSINILYETC